MGAFVDGADHILSPCTQLDHHIVCRDGNVFSLYKWTLPEPAVTRVYDLQHEASDSMVL